MSQTSYENEMDAGVSGDLTGSGPRNVQSLNNPDSILYFGRAVQRKAGTEKGVKQLNNGSVSADIAGTTTRDPQQEEGYYPVASAAGLMNIGDMHVELEETVAVGDDVYVRKDGKFQIQTIDLDIDLVALNVFAIDIAGNTLTETYAASHNATMTALAVQIALQPSVATAVAAGKTITVTSSSIDTDVVIDNAAVTLGATQPIITIAESTASIGSENLGIFRKDADGGTAIAFTNCKYRDSGVAGKTAVVSVLTL